jgi:hypothetical protein
MIRTFGNIVAAEIAPAITYLEHFKSVEGERLKDAIKATQKSVTIPFTFDEINQDNVEKLMYSSRVATTKAIALGSTNVPMEGRAIVRFKTTIGTSFEYIIPRCALKAEGGLPFNIDSWMQGKFTLEILKCDDASQASYPYGYVDFDLTASTTLSDCETIWTRIGTVPADKIPMSATATNFKIGTKALRVTVATLWNYNATKGVHASNTIAYTSFAATNVRGYPFISAWCRASKDFADSDIRLGFYSTATPIGAPSNYTDLLALGAAVTWERSRIPIHNVNATNMDAIKCIALIGTNSVEFNTDASQQTFWIDDVKLTK